MNLVCKPEPPCKRRLQGLGLQPHWRAACRNSHTHQGETWSLPCLGLGVRAPALTLTFLLRDATPSTASHEVGGARRGMRLEPGHRQTSSGPGWSFTCFSGRQRGKPGGAGLEGKGVSFLFVKRSFKGEEMNMGTVEAGMWVRMEQRAVLRGELGPGGPYAQKVRGEGRIFPYRPCALRINQGQHTVGIKERLAWSLL